MPDHLTSPISNEITAFIIDRQARRCSPKTISFYEDELRLFQKYLLENEISIMSKILPDDIRQYLIDLSARRSQGGVHAAYRAIKAFFNWYEAEIDEPLYRNPIKRVKPPKITATPLPGVSLGHIQDLRSGPPRPARPRHDPGPARYRFAPQRIFSPQLCRSQSQNGSCHRKSGQRRRAP